MDLLVAGFVGATNVMVLTVGQRQLDVVGQEVTDRAAVQVRVLHVANAVGEVALAEGFDLYRVLALGKGVHCRSGNQRADDNA